jgi:hypothetical protein
VAERYKADVYKIYDPELQSVSSELTADSEREADAQKSYHKA